MVKFQFQERGLIGFLLQMTLSKNCDVKEPEGGGGRVADLNSFHGGFGA